MDMMEAFRRAALRVREAMEITRDVPQRAQLSDLRRALDEAVVRPVRLAPAPLPERVTLEPGRRAIRLVGSDDV